MDGPGDASVVLTALGGTHLVAARCAAVDLIEHRIPNRAVAAIGALAIGAAAITGCVPLVTVGALAAAGPLWLIRYGNGVALGDVKFAAALGAAGGLIDPLVGLVGIGLTALSSAAYGLISRCRSVALAPWMWLGWTAAGALHLGLGARLPWLS